MTPERLRPEVVAERAAWIRERLADLRRLPLDTYEAFESDARTPAAAESHLRRALEALLDLGRHVLAKRFARATTEYKEIAVALIEVGVLDADQGRRLRDMAGYRNRLVHFYAEITHRELYRICTTELEDLERVLDVLLEWITADGSRVTDPGAGRG